MFRLPDLPYKSDSLEPYIDARTMEIHHDRHHAAYTDNLNQALSRHPEIKAASAEELLIDLSAVPEDTRSAVKNNGGGYVNHNFFWQIMTPRSSPPTGSLLTAINSVFSDLSGFQEKFSAKALGHFGSGWAWLVLENKKLEITDTANQDSPLSEGRIPLLAIDVWEHAYYLKYQNRRAEYIRAWWHVVNWDKVSELFLSHIS
jgi:Fe-Mn family superoxide dismutase